MQFKSRVICWQNPIFWGGQSFFYATGQMRPIHTIEGNLLFSKTDLNVTFI